MDALFQTTYLELALQEYAERVRERYRENLAQHDHHASGNLMSTIRAYVEVHGTTYEACLDLQDYWKYVEEDTRPHWPPRDAILKWIAIKGIIPRPDKNGRLPKPEQLAFLISRAMAGESPNQKNLKNPNGGTTGTHDLAEAKAATLPEFEESILRALERDTLAFLEKIIP